MIKNIILIQLLLTVVFTLNAQQKHALLIGIGAYTEASGWDKLHGHNDIFLLESVLSKKGFENKNIITLIDTAATKEAVIQSLKTLEKKLQKGDIVYFHFSGHGQQVWDDNGDEIDELDEALVPYASPQKHIAGQNEGEQLIRDDQLKKHFNAIREKIGTKGHLLVTIDACHSGTATRGLVKARGTDIIMASDDFIKNRAEKINDLYRFEKGTSDKNLAPMVSLFSSSANQLSYEGKAENGGQYGIFSYALCQEMLNANSMDTYEKIFLAVKSKIQKRTSKQTPILEGEPDALLLNGKLKDIPKHYSVQEVIDNDLVILSSGSLHGLSRGSQVVFYPSGTSDTSKTKAIAVGKVDQVLPLSTDILVQKSKGKTLQNAWAFIRKKNYGSLGVNLQINIKPFDKQEVLQQLLAEQPFINLSEKEPDLFLEKITGFAGNSVFELVTNDETVLWRKESKKENIQRLSNEIIKTAANYAQANFLKSIETYSNFLTPKVEILVKEGNEFYPSSNQAIQVGQVVKLKISNIGDEPFYFSVIDITPNHECSLIIPSDRPAADFFLDTNQSYLSEAFEVEPPFGSEVLKVIATHQPLNLKGAIATRGRQTKVNSPLEILLSKSFYPQSATRGESQAIYDDDSAITSFYFEIKK